MAEHPTDSDFDPIPVAHVEPKSRWTFQIVWLIPIVSLLIGGWLAVKAIMEKGPTITITLKNAEGLEAGKTKVKFKDVEIGLVKSVSLAPDLKHVVATAELVKDFSPHLVDDTRFWVVSPRISGGTVSGLSTLLSGSYIGVDTGSSKNKRSSFSGLDKPPVVPVDTAGREFVLHSTTMASVDSGSPVFFRRLQVGQVTSYELDRDGKGVTMKVFVNEPYDKYVGLNTRFWNASGIDMKLDADGVKVEMESIVSLLLGGIAFETPESASVLPASASTSYTLFHNRTDAMKNPENDVVKAVMVFRESARGLSPGAPIDFRGIVVGEVAAVKLDTDPVTHQIIVPVEVNLYPQRMRARSRTAMAERDTEGRKRYMDELVAHGLRAQMRSGSLITGALYIALDFFPAASKASMKWSDNVAEIPTIPGARQELQQAIASVAAKIERFPLEEIGRDVRTAVNSADRLLKRVDTEVTPDLKQALQSGTKLLTRLDVEVAPEVKDAVVEAKKALAAADRLLSVDAPIQQDTREAMREVARAAHSFRILADYLERNPSSLLMGKKEDLP